MIAVQHVTSEMRDTKFDFCIIGGGIVGVATAAELARRHPSARILLLEKETTLAKHQTGHNSGVIHSGIYYKPNSLKARLCKRGAAATRQFCEENGIRFENRGKLIVATNEIELNRLDKLHENAKQNHIVAEMVTGTELAKLEPNISGHAALFVPSAAIVDYVKICHTLAEKAQGRGAEFVLGAEVEHIRETASEVIITAGERNWRAHRLVICGGLQADRLARMAGLSVDHQIIPFRGEYYFVRAEKRNLVHHLIYPVPDPALPFLGVHLTPMIDGSLSVGPNAVLGWAREGYPKSSLDLRDTAEFLAFSGLWKVMRQNWRFGATEMWDSLYKPSYVRKCRKYCPSLRGADLTSGRAGIRAQAVMRDGTLVSDFLFLDSDRILHVGNAPSPAATSAMAIAEVIAERLEGAPAPL